jgi:hypothetical protein
MPLNLFIRHLKKNKPQIGSLKIIKLKQGYLIFAVVLNSIFFPKQI